MALRYPTIDNPVNPYRDNVQGKANEPICVAGLLDRAKQVLGPAYEGLRPTGRWRRFMTAWKTTPRGSSSSAGPPIIPPTSWII